MNWKIATMFLLVTALILIEGYLITSSIIDKEKEKKETQEFCQRKCDYNKDSFAWEFSGETVTKGFTTKEECFNYCGKVRLGFVASIYDGFIYVFSIFLSDR